MIATWAMPLTRRLPKGCAGGSTNSSARPPTVKATTIGSHDPTGADHRAGSVRLRAATSARRPTNASATRARVAHGEGSASLWILIVGGSFMSGLGASDARHGTEIPKAVTRLASLALASRRVGWCAPPVSGGAGTLPQIARHVHPG